MHTLKRDLLYDIGGLTRLIPPRRKSLVEHLLGRLAIGQILREQFVYEVHGPYVAADPGQIRCPFSKRLIDGLSAWTSRLVRRRRLRRAASDLAELDDRLLRDIGLTWAEIDAAVFGAPIRARHN